MALPNSTGNRDWGEGELLGSAGKGGIKTRWTQFVFLSQVPNKIFLLLKFKLNLCLTAPLQSKSTPSFKSIFSSSSYFNDFLFYCYCYLKDHEIVKRSQTHIPTHICIHIGKKKDWKKPEQNLNRGYFCTGWWDYNFLFIFL